MLMKTKHVKRRLDYSTAQVAESVLFAHIKCQMAPIEYTTTKVSGRQKIGCICVRLISTQAAAGIAAVKKILRSIFIGHHVPPDIRLDDLLPQFSS